MTIRTVLELLEERGKPARPLVFNPWRDVDPMDISGPMAPVERCARLEHHLRCPDPRLVLVGEAPGYQGCHFSGIPFTNEKLLMLGSIPRLEDHTDKRITTRYRPWCEPSATIMWGALHGLKLAAHTVMWNAFAFHPYQSPEAFGVHPNTDTTHSNRTPTLSELASTRDILQAVIELYPGVPVVAVGGKASQCLDSLGVKVATCLRHPANGGATLFREGLKKYASKS